MTDWCLECGQQKDHPIHIWPGDGGHFFAAEGQMTVEVAREELEQSIRRIFNGGIPSDTSRLITAFERAVAAAALRAALEQVEDKG